MKSSKTLSWLALGGVALALTACGGGEQEPTTDADGNTVITYWHAYSADSPELKTLEETVIPAFEKANPGVKVESVPYPYDQLHQKLLTATAGGTLPCLVRSDIIWVPELAKLGTLAPLSDEMEDFDEIASKTYPGPLATTEYDGKNYGLPLDTNTRVMLYNRDTLKEAGLSKAPATFDDMRKLADGLEGTGDYAFADNDTAGWNLLPWIWSAGGTMMNEDMTKATGYLNSPESVEGVQLLVDLYEQGEIPDIVTGAKGGEETAVGLPKGDYASILDGPWMYPIFEDQNPDFDVQAAPVPAGDGGSVSVVGGEDVVMTSSCPSKDDAEDFIRFMLSDEAQKDMAETGQMPVLSGMGSELTDIKPYYGTFAKQLETAKPRPPHPEYPKMEEILRTEVQKAFTGDASVQEALDAAAEQIDGILAGS